MRLSRRLLAPVLAAVLAAGVSSAAPAVAAADKPDAALPASTSHGYLPPARHVFVINLENTSYDTTWGPGSAAPYLSQTLRAKGVLLSQYYGIAHNSLPNYLAEISGQGPSMATQADCPTFAPFAATGVVVAPGQAVGQGCVFPSQVTTLADQLTAAGLTWKGYMEDMGTPCRHPALGAVDDTQKAKVGDQYAARHNPFVYFRSLTDSGQCAAHDVDLSALPADLASISTTPNLSYITPNLCHDGHDSPCVDGAPGGLTSADAWLKTWVPKILASPAFTRDGLLLITFDEASTSDASGCCAGFPTPNTPMPGITGTGGGRVGLLAISPFIAPNTWSSTSYNHYSLLASLEDLFGLGYLGFAADPKTPRFGLDVYNGRW